MSSATELIPLTKTNIPPASEMFALAFHNDPMMTHLLPDSSKRLNLSPRSFRCIRWIGTPEMKTRLPEPTDVFKDKIIGRF
jgi:hypothetical protein